MYAASRSKYYIQELLPWDIICFKSERNKIQISGREFTKLEAAISPIKCMLNEKDLHSIFKSSIVQVQSSLTKHPHTFQHDENFSLPPLLAANPIGPSRWKENVDTPHPQNTSTEYFKSMPMLSEFSANGNRSSLLIHVCRHFNLKKTPTHPIFPQSNNVPVLVAIRRCGLISFQHPKVGKSCCAGP